jgi:putative transposase
MSYSTGSHTGFYHRYHIVWITKYRYKVLQGKLRERVRDIIRQVCREIMLQCRDRRSGTKCLGKFRE